MFSHHGVTEGTENLPFLSVFSVSLCLHVVMVER